MSADDLAAFLTARYDEAEALAKAATPGPWRATGQRDHFVEQAEGDHIVAEMEGCADHPDTGKRDSAYIADVDPAHRLADITLKRAILAGHARVKSYDGGHGCRVCDWDSHCELVSGSDEWCATVRQLGTEFNGHPGYKEDWKP